MTVQCIALNCFSISYIFIKFFSIARKRVKINTMKQNGLSFYKKKKKISSYVIREIFYWCISIFVVIFLALALVYFFGMTSSVVGVSMEPTLYNEQTILIDRISYTFSSPKKGDVILFLPNGNANSHFYTKRVVANSGDTVLIEDGILYVNGEPSEVYTEYLVEAGIAVNELVVESGTCFVLGDNASLSEDSRSANIGTVSTTDIIGKVWYAAKFNDKKGGFVK